MNVAQEIVDAATVGDETRLREMLEDDAELANVYSPDGWTPLHLAAHFGHTNTVRWLLEAGADVHARSRNDLANQPLHAAAAGQAPVELLTLLLDAGADINARQRGGFTPLQATAQNGNLAATELLLAHGADAWARTDDGQTALSLALEGNHETTASLLRAHGITEQIFPPGFAIPK
ncbi:MAG TPA: ankyrin repeat domain-containing protein [Ktedonobacterales bacterium]|nr:ankyrin repeat domain-containing protein [Ktedonobacterales bacterium]